MSNPEWTDPGDWEDRPSAIDDILAERNRQVVVEGWTPEHDDEHTKGEMAEAAACYAVSRWIVEHRQFPYNQQSNLDVWPWDRAWWKPKNRRSDLVRAGALIVAEIERLDRATEQGAPHGQRSTED